MRRAVVRFNDGMSSVRVRVLYLLKLVGDRCIYKYIIITTYIICIYIILPIPTTTNNAIVLCACVCICVKNE